MFVSIPSMSRSLLVLKGHPLAPSSQCATRNATDRIGHEGTSSTISGHPGRLWVSLRTPTMRIELSGMMGHLRHLSELRRTSRRQHAEIRCFQAFQGRRARSWVWQLSRQGVRRWTTATASNPAVRWCTITIVVSKHSRNAHSVRQPRQSKPQEPAGPRTSTLRNR